MVKKNASAIKRMKFNATQRAEFMAQHEANDVVEPYQYTQLLAPFAWQKDRKKKNQKQTERKKERKKEREKEINKERSKKERKNKLRKQ